MTTVFDDVDDARQAPPGCVYRALPPVKVRVCDPAGVHRIWRVPMYGERVGINARGHHAWTVCVKVLNTVYTVRPDWVEYLEPVPTAPGPGAVLIAFPLRGRFATRSNA
jgi:hypothetical protein